MGYLWLARFPWMPLALRATLVTAALVGVLWFLVRRAVSAYRRVMSALGRRLPMEMDPGAPVNVICWPDQMDRLRRLEPTEGDAGAFEPEVHRVLIASRTSLASRMHDPRFRARFFASVIALPILIQVTVQLAVHGLVEWESLLLVAGLAALTPFAWNLIRPTYLRVAPGRVDIVRFGFVGGRARVTPHSLRDRPVRLDLRRHELLIGGWHPSHPDARAADPAQEESEAAIARFSGVNTKDPQASLGTPAQIRRLTIIPLWGTLEIGPLERAVFRASVSTAVPGPLPDDALSG
jgi:hypothetical protein